MKIDGNKILDKLSAGKKGDRKRTSLYLSESLLKEFTSHCGDIAPSQVMEELMKEFIDSTSPQATKKPKK